MRLFIYGNGSFGKEAFDIAKRVNDKDSIYGAIYFINDFEYDNISIFSFDEIISRCWSNESHEVVIAMGEVNQRVKILTKLKKFNFKLGRLIDPSSIISDTAVINNGCIICPFVFIGPDVCIGENTLVNVKSIIGHDIKIGSNTVVSAMVNIGGNSVIGDECYLGMSSVIKEKTKIEFKCILSMGAVLYNDLPEKVIAIGNPARIIRKVEEEHNVFK